MRHRDLGNTTSVVPRSRVQVGTRAIQPSAGSASRWLSVLDETIATCARHGRTDLHEWLSGRRAQLLAPQLRVLVTGATAQGKSHLVNALINAPVCRDSEPVATPIATVVSHGDVPAASLVRRAFSTADWIAEQQHRVALSAERLSESLTEALLGQPASVIPLLHAEVEVPRALLANGLVLIDTPPLTDLPEASQAAIADLRLLVTYARADLVMFVCESTREITDAELEVLGDLARLYPHLVLALTKTDIAPRWRERLARTNARLTDAGVPATVIAVSTVLRQHALRSSSDALNDESGYPHLIGHLQRTMAAKSDELARDTVSLLGRLAAERISTPLRANLKQQGDPSGATAELHEAQRRLEELRRATGRWQNCLADESADLMSDIEHDLRERTRAILAEAERTLETVDPARAWDDFEPWLRQALREAGETSFGWLAERAEWLTRRVAEELPESSSDPLPEWVSTAVDEAPDRTTNLSAPPVERFTVSQKLFIGLRGSYGGILMVGLVTSLSGMSLINPFSIGGGALFGGKTIRDESKSLLRRRQATARMAVQRHVDEIFVGLAKDARDSVRRLQRNLRDHFSAVTEDIHDAIMDSMRSAKAAADHDLAARAQHVRRTEQELDRLADLFAQAQALTPRQSPALTGAGSETP